MTAEPNEVVVCVTPFTQDGELDLGLVEAHLRRVMGHVRRVMIGGSGTEEGFALSPDERRSVLELAVALGGELGAEVRLNGLEPRHPAFAVEDVRLARETGAKAIHLPILDIGHGVRPRVDELDAYLATVLAEVGDLDVYISTSMAMGQLWPVDVLRRAAEHPSVKGAIVGAPDPVYLGEVIRAMPGKTIHMAGTPQLANGFILGATGFVSPEGNVAPQVTRAVSAAVGAGDWEAVRLSIGTLMRITAAVHPWGLSSGFKALLRGLGILAAHVRSPRIDIPAAAETALAADVRDALDHWSANAGPISKEQQCPNPMS